MPETRNKVRERATVLTAEGETFGGTIGEPNTKQVTPSQSPHTRADRRCRLGGNEEPFNANFWWFSTLVNKEWQRFRLVGDVIYRQRVTEGDVDPETSECQDCLPSLLHT